MLSAREFYRLQKLQRQGKLKDNPAASALVAEVTEALQFSQRNTSEAGPIIPTTMSSVTTPSSHGNPTSRPKKSRKRKRKLQRENNRGENDDVYIPISKITPNESNTASVPETRKLSRSQRKKLRKKLKKSLTVENTASRSSEALTNVQSTDDDSTNAKRPRSSLHSPAVDIPSKRPCLPEEHINVPVQTGVTVGGKSSPSKLELKTDNVGTHEHISQNSVDMGKEELAHILTPLPVDEFFEKYFEKSPLFLQRNTRTNDWLTTQDLDDMLRENRIMFTEHLDVASYRDGQRLTLNPPGRAFRPIVWDLYNSGCSLRLLCPQLFFKHIRYRLSLLHEYFGCFVGCNVYLTPPGSQGFAPHYDDIEAFILQLEGSKRWRVYAPRDASERLPRTPSPNLTQEELGEPTLTVTLTPGDLLYLPRGYIHQADTNDTSHSLHITISTYQKHTWSDFISKLLPIALQTAVETNVTFREGLPIGILQHVGGFAGTHTENTKLSDESEPLRGFRAKVVSLLRQLVDLIERPVGASEFQKNDNFPNAVDPLLNAADVFAVDLIGQALPPQLSEAELTCHVLKQGERWNSGAEGAPLTSSGVVNAVELKPDTKVRLVRWSAVRAVRTRLAPQHSDSEEDESSSSSELSTNASDGILSSRSNSVIAVYHSLSNTNVFKERDPDEMALDAELLPALDYLARAFPKFVSVDSLPLPNLDDQLRTATGLYEAGFLVTENPLPAIEVETDDETENRDDYSPKYDEGSMIETFHHDSVDLDNFETSSDDDDNEERDSRERFLLFESSDSSGPSLSEDDAVTTKRPLQQPPKYAKSMKRKPKR